MPKIVKICFIFKIYSGKSVDSFSGPGVFTYECNHAIYGPIGLVETKVVIAIPGSRFLQSGSNRIPGLATSQFQNFEITEIRQNSTFSSVK